MHNYICPVDHFEIWVRVAQTYKCPLCGHVMRYVTSKHE